MCALVDLLKNCGIPNAPGTRTSLYLIPEAELTAWPQTAEELGGTDPGDTMILDEPFAFVATVGLGYWRTVSIVVDTGQITDGLVGEIGGRSFDNQFIFFLAGLEAERLEFAKEISNCCFVALLPDRQDIFRVLGRFQDPAFIDAINLDTGLASGDRRGGAYVFRTSSGSPSMIYDSVTHGINVTPNP